MRRPMAITEHFSAYHFKFNGTGAGMRRIKRIFHQGIPVFVVSHALETDIKEFAGPPLPPFRTIDNAVDTSLFKPNATAPRSEGRFFALAQWRYPKRPEILIAAIAALRKRGYAATLRLGGTGPMSAAIADKVRELGLEEHVVLLGNLTQAEAADEMQRAHAFVHAADYETYSAVCAEALCCGTFTIASQVGGIPEFLDARSGALVAVNEAEAWASAIQAEWQRAMLTEPEEIAERMRARCAPGPVGTRYAALLRDLVAGRMR
ncbi:MAG: glycosyltransferase family 4 protein [Flavobacteriales bacterium]|nr:glycosyltransferase family 4 protein [Flavobacteriales bacterium]